MITDFKEFTLVAILKLWVSLLQVLDPTYDKLWIPNFELGKGNFNFRYKSAWLLHYRQQGRNVHQNSEDIDCCKI